jgi:peptidyl-prolyl cis-trans isomerase D
MIVMAVIGKIRKRSGLLVVIIGVALAAFVLGDFLNPGSRRRTPMIGIIAGGISHIMSSIHGLRSSWNKCGSG